MRWKLIVALGAVVLLAGAGAAVAYSGLAARSPTRRPAAAPGLVRAGDSNRPLLAVVGASFSAGVGAGNSRDAWPEDLGRLLHWQVVVSADPGAGYVSPGVGHRGPFSRLTANLDLAALDPAVVIIQGGHDDIGRPLSLIRSRVERLVADVHREAPHAILAVLSVFARGSEPSRSAWATDRTIVAAARNADPGVLVFDPLAHHWRFPRLADHLHPTAAGHHAIARRLARGLRERLAGLRKPHAPATAPTILRNIT